MMAMSDETRPDDRWRVPVGPGRGAGCPCRWRVKAPRAGHIDGCENDTPQARERERKRKRREAYARMAEVPTAREGTTHP